MSGPRSGRASRLDTSVSTNCAAADEGAGASAMPVCGVHWAAAACRADDCGAVRPSAQKLIVVVAQRTGVPSACVHSHAYGVDAGTLASGQLTGPGYTFAPDGEGPAEVRV